MNPTSFDSTLANRPLPAPLRGGAHLDLIAPGAVTFVLYAPFKPFVSLVGDFNGWNSRANLMVTNGAGLWWTTIPHPGPTRYGFYVAVDAQSDAWVADPYATEVRWDETGPWAWLSSEAKLRKRRVFPWHDEGWRTPALADLVIYELCVRDFNSKWLANQPVYGSFIGVESKLDYLVDLGVNAIELMPIQQFPGQSSWGYNPVFYFAPAQVYGAPEDLKRLVNGCHRRGIALILDVALNHAWGDHPYYRIYPPMYGPKGEALPDLNPFFHHTPDAVNMWGGVDWDHFTPETTRHFQDMVRYWLREYHVDGFRFDLAPILGRTGNGFSNQSHFFSVLRQDPTLATVKLIAEPWDIGLGGYQLGNFPPQWLEWNDRFRDVCRRFWRGDNAMVPEFAKRLHGSSDIFESRSRRPCSSVNFICSHDGFTLHDLVTYQDRHNEANGEQNLDGHGSNFSYNFGVEGETENVITNQLRTRQKRNLLTTLFIAQGTPMLLGGDEMGNSQQGNNNAYCQDNDIAWLDWQKADAQQQIEFTKQLIKLRKEHPLLNRTLYQHGSTFSKKTGLADISWLNSQGLPMQETDWHDAATKCFAMLLAQTEALAEVVNEENEGSFEQQDDALLIIFNAHPCEIEFQLPQLTGYWQTLINTAVNEITTPIEDEKPQANLRNTSLCVAAHSCIVLAYSHDVPDDFIENSIDE